MGYFDKGLFSFLSDLADNNNKEWFAKNKHRYEEDLKEPFLDFISDAGPSLRKLSRNLVADPRPVGGSLFRIYRDVRFSKDKSPYKTAAGAQFQLGGKGVHGPGYYLHLEPGQCFVAGGMWMPEPDALVNIRRAIADKPAEWRKVGVPLNDHDVDLKRPPRGFDPAHPYIADIKRKSFTASSKLTQREVLGPDLMRTFIARCEEIAPLMKFLAKAVGVAW